MELSVDIKGGLMNDRASARSSKTVDENRIRMIIREELARLHLIDDRFLSVNEVAEILDCHRNTVYVKHFKKGLKYVTDTKRGRKVKHSDLMEYIRLHQTTS